MTLYGDSSNTTLVSNTSIAFDGSEASRTVVITPTAGITGTTTITVTVDDGLSTASDAFLLTIGEYHIHLPLVLAQFQPESGSAKCY